MAYERIMGIEVTNKAGYQSYREHMLPILTRYNANFGFDFVVSEVLKSKEDKAINRVFTIDFPSKIIMDKFFSDPDYLSVKQQFFSTSVGAVTTISLHEKG